MTLDGMAPDRWQEIKSILAAAIERPMEERSKFLLRHCSGRESLHRELVSLLSAFGDGSFLEATPVPLAVQLRPGELLGSFRIQRFLGRGGMGEVYEALQESPLKRLVALKVMHPTMRSEPQAVARFQAEGQALALMEHPHIARVFETGTDAKGRLYVAMEAVDGEPITLYCRRRRLTVTQRLELVRKVCDGVQHAHQRGVLHRDLKPQNVLVVDADGEAVPKIIDFGVAKIFDNPLSDPTYETEYGQLLGTPEYMSPEQALRDPRKIDTRSDVYALGLLLYELLVGHRPRKFPVAESGDRRDLPAPSRRWQGLDPEEQRKLGQERQSSPTTHERALRGDLDLVVLKALEYDPDRRYESPAALGADIARVQKAQPIQARRPDLLYLATTFIRRRRALATVVGVCLLAITFGVISLTVGFNRAVAAEGLAAEQAREAVTATLEAQREAAIAKETGRFLRYLFQARNPLQGPYLQETTLVDILEQGARSIDQLEHLPQVQISLLSDLASSFSNLGKHRKARALNEAALTRHLEFRGFDHKNTPFLLRQNGLLSTYIGDLEHGRRMIRSAIEFWDRGSGMAGDLAGAHLNLGTNYILAAEFEAAANSLLMALELSEEVDRPRLTAMILSNLGATLSEIEDYSAALAYLSRAETLYRSLGSRELDMTALWSSMAHVEIRMGKLTEARARLERVLELELSTLGPDHVYIAASLSSLARIDLLEGRLSQALEQGQRARSILTAEYGERHIQVANTTVELAAIHQALDQRKDAERLYRWAVEVLEEQAGSESKLLIQPLEKLSELLQQSGQTAEASTLARRASRLRHSKAVESQDTQS